MSDARYAQICVGARSWRVAVATRPMTWSEALAFAESLGSGWRIPHREELSLLAGDAVALARLSDVAREALPRAAIDPNTSRPFLWFWSVSPVSGRSEMVWSYGLAANSPFFNFEKLLSESVLCVRS